MREELTYAPAEPEGRAPLTTDELELVVDAFLADLEDLVVVADWSGTELVSLVLGVAFKLFATVDAPPAERAAQWRYLAAQIEARLGEGLH